MCHKRRWEGLIYALFNHKMNYSPSCLEVYSCIKVTMGQIVPPSLGNFTEVYKNSKQERLMRDSNINFKIMLCEKLVTGCRIGAYICRKGSKAVL
jgi:hypothetical protein